MRLQREKNGSNKEVQYLFYTHLQGERIILNVRENRRILVKKDTCT